MQPAPADFVGEKVQYLQHGVKSWEGFYASVVFIYELFLSHVFQVENHKELDHRTQVNRYDSLGCVFG
jgi:hypothetical protein